MVSTMNGEEKTMAKIDLEKVVRCTDIQKVYRLDKPTIKYNSVANNEAAKHDGCYGIQQLMDKFRKIYGWRVHSNKWNAAEKSIDITIMNNTEIVGVKHFSYEDICKEMWWHSFEIVAEDTIRPVPFTWEEKEAVIQPMLKATAKKDAKNPKLQAPAEEATEKVA